MSFYGDHVFPRVMNRLMNNKQMRETRARVCAPLAGDIVEIGFGTGLNLPHLPPAVTVLRAVDPLERGRNLASERIAASPVSVEFVGLDGQSLPLPDHSVDAALATWTLCSIPDPVAAVREIKRVLRPGGTLHFIEHGCSPDPQVLKWQRRLNPIQRRLACGCNLDRDIPSTIQDGGMRVDSLKTYYMKNDPKFLGWTFEGVASAAS